LLNRLSKGKSSAIASTSQVCFGSAPLRTIANGAQTDSLESAGMLQHGDDLDGGQRRHSVALATARHNMGLDGCRLWSNPRECHGDPCCNYGKVRRIDQAVGYDSRG